jgi:hypothetical protein
MLGAWETLFKFGNQLTKPTRLCGKHYTCNKENIIMKSQNFECWLYKDGLSLMEFRLS